MEMTKHIALMTALALGLLAPVQAREKVEQSRREQLIAFAREYKKTTIALGLGAASAAALGVAYYTGTINGETFDKMTKWLKDQKTTAEGYFIVGKLNGAYDAACDACKNVYAAAGAGVAKVGAGVKSAAQTTQNTVSVQAEKVRGGVASQWNKLAGLFAAKTQKATEQVVDAAKNVAETASTMFNEAAEKTSAVITNASESLSEGVEKLGNDLVEHLS